MYRLAETRRSNGNCSAEGDLDNVSYEAYREWILDRCELSGIVTLHKDTFQPDTGVRTCILFLRKPEDGEMPREDYNIFMQCLRELDRTLKAILCLFWTEMVIAPAF